MTDRLADLQARMDAAAAALDFETARALRDEISLLRGGGDTEDIDTSGLSRQQPGAMGLGTSQARYSKPDGWVKPTKPDPMTKGRSRPRQSR